jgi:hypothetical protein
VPVTRPEERRNKMEKKVLWIGTDCCGSLIDAADVKTSVYLGYDHVRIWDSIPGSQEPTIPAVIEWDGEEYADIRDTCYDYAVAYLDSLVGAESRVAQDWEPATDVLAYSFQENSFGSLSDWGTAPTYTYFCNSNHKVEYLQEDQTEYEIDILDTYNLDYARNKTNREFGGIGEHAKLHKIRLDGEPSDLLLWHEWSQWAGSELDTGELVTVAEALSRLRWLDYSGERHPKYEEIESWIAQ